MQSLTIATKFENSIFTIEKTMLCSFLLQIELKGVNFSLMLFVFITYTGFQHDFHIRCYLWLLPVVRQTPLVELLTFPNHMSAHWFLWFVLLNLTFQCSVLLIIVCLFGSLSFGHCIVCSMIYVFWLPLWDIQAFLRANNVKI